MYSRSSTVRSSTIAKQELLFIGDVPLPESTAEDPFPLLRTLTFISDCTTHPFLYLLQQAYGWLPGAFPGLRRSSTAFIKESQQEITSIVCAQEPQMGGTLLLGLALVRGTVYYISNVSTVRSPSGCDVPLHGEVVAGLPTSIAEVSAGETHFAACDFNGQSYTWGWKNEWGQLGVGTAWSTPPSTQEEPLVGGHVESMVDTVHFIHPSAPQHIKTPFQRLQCKISAVACGRAHTVFLCSTQAQLYTCGKGKEGQLGCGPSAPLSLIPRCVKCLSGIPIKSISAAGEQCAAIASTGKVFVWGDNRIGSMGCAERRLLFTPTSLYFEGHGSDFDSSDVEAARKSATRAPTGSVQSMLYPPRLRHLSTKTSFPVTKICCSLSHSILVTKEGAIYTAGYEPNDLGGHRVVSVDAYGALGRFRGGVENIGVEKKRGMGAVAASSGSAGLTVPFCGFGYTVFHNSSEPRALRLVGRVSDRRGGVICGSGLRHCVGTSVGYDGVDSVEVTVPRGHRVVSVYPMTHGLCVVTTYSAPR